MSAGGGRWEGRGGGEEGGLGTKFRGNDTHQERGEGRRLRRRTERLRRCNDELRSTAASQPGLNAGSITVEASDGRRSVICISLLCYQKSDRIKVRMRELFNQHDTPTLLCISITRQHRSPFETLVNSLARLARGLLCQPTYLRRRGYLGRMAAKCQHRCSTTIGALPHSTCHASLEGGRPPGPTQAWLRLQ